MWQGWEGQWRPVEYGGLKPFVRVPEMRHMMSLFTSSFVNYIGGLRLKTNERKISGA